MTEQKLDVRTQLQNEPKNHIRNILIALIFVVIIVSTGSTIEFKGVSEQGQKIAQNIVLSLFKPDFEILFRFSTKGVMFLLLETMGIAFLGTLIGALISIPLAFLSARNIVPRFVSWIGLLLVTTIRTFPIFVYAIMFLRVTGPGPFAGVLTLAVTSIGMVSKLFIEAIEDLDQGIIEALDAAGCSTIQKIRYGIIPQLLSNFISVTIYRFEINIKNASVLGIVGAGGIGAPLIFAMAAYRWSEVGSLLLGLIILVLIIEYFSTKIRTKLA